MDLSQNDPRFSDFQNVKRRFFALRNGIIADTLRRAGDPHTIIFGLTLPQLREVAEATGKDDALAALLWQNESTRESRLLAPMLMDAGNVTAEAAERMVESVICPEEADILCHRLLRHTPSAISMIDRFKDSEKPLQRYTALRLMFNLVSTNPLKAKELAIAEAERKDPLTARTAALLADEADFFLEES